MTPLLAQGLRTDRSFERIYRRHVGDVYRYALAVLHHAADAEDVTQTTFLNAYRAFQRGERPRNPQNWLITIAHNVCRQRFRQAQRRPEEVAYDDGIGEAVRDEERPPTADDIQRGLAHLAFNQRAALVMRELEGRSYGEIAEILGLSVSAVETLIFRARRALREQLEGTLTCLDAERAISRRADGQLARAERAALRAHLRECKECERLARSQRAQRTAFKALAAVPIPTSVTTLFGGGSVAGGAVAAKAAALVAAGVSVTGVGLQGADRVDRRVAPPARAAAPAVEVARPVASEKAEAPVSARPLRLVAKSRAKPAKPVKAAHGRATAPGQQKRVAAADATSPGPKAKPKVKRKSLPAARSAAHAAKAPHAKNAPKAERKKAKPAPHERPEAPKNPKNPKS
jgi:RNA polymerase sigma-70 factor (ECF subfamily)